jgi:hypothetical protein
MGSMVTTSEPITFFELTLGTNKMLTKSDEKITAISQKDNLRMVTAVELV